MEQQETFGTVLEEVRQVPYLVSLEAENLLLHPPYPALPNYAASQSSACPLQNGRATHGHRSLLKSVDGTHIHKSKKRVGGQSTKSAQACCQSRVVHGASAGIARCARSRIGGTNPCAGGDEHNPPCRPGCCQEGLEYVDTIED